MFKIFKNKIENWIKKSKKYLEKTPEDTEIIRKKIGKKEITKSEKPQKKTKQKKLNKKKIEKIQEKADKIIEKAKKQKIPEISNEFSPGLQKYQPNLGEIKKDISFFKKLRQKISYKINEKEFNEIFDELELLLLENNFALEVIENIKEKLSKELIGKEIKKSELEKEIKNKLKENFRNLLIEPDNILDSIKLKKYSEHQPFIILFFGINGAGKTTTIAKITDLLKKNKFSVVIGAADTFRAAAIEQLEEHSEKLKVPLIKHEYKSDPAAVGFDTIKYAKNNKIDVVLIDSAGRMHTKTNLLKEMEKICSVTNPDLKIFVAESIAGNDAIEQAKKFNEAIEIDGSILTKTDIDEKGGTIISISYATNKPIFYLGKGQKYEDLELFNKNKFIEDLGL